MSAWKAKAETQLRALLDDGIVEFQDLHPFNVAEIGRGFYRVYADFPGALRRLCGLLSSASPLVLARNIHIEARAYAETYHEERLVIFNASFFRDPERLAKRIAHDEHYGWLPAGCVTPEAVAIHEFGHVVWNWLQRSPSANTHLQQFIRRYPYIMGHSLSGDAAASDAELWAMGFAAHYCGSEEIRHTLYVQEQWRFLRPFIGAAWRAAE